MGNSLHDKIYLGRRPHFKTVQVLLLFTMMAGAALAWYIAQ